jgi:hypothetical protein
VVAEWIFADKSMINLKFYILWVFRRVFLDWGPVTENFLLCSQAAREKKILYATPFFETSAHGLRGVYLLGGW